MTPLLLDIDMEEAERWGFGATVLKLVNPDPGWGLAGELWLLEEAERWGLDRSRKGLGDRWNGPLGTLLPG